MTEPCAVLKQEHESEPLYYLASFQHGRWGGCVIWWKPNNCGYTNDLEQAGIYTQSQIDAHRSYYDNGDTVPVPVSFVLNKCRIRRMVDAGDSANRTFHSAEKLRAALIPVIVVDNDGEMEGR
jgi:hypothetical protein